MKMNLLINEEYTEIPKNLFKNDYDITEFNCPHCSIVFKHFRNDLSMQICVFCNNKFICDDIGLITKL